MECKYVGPHKAIQFWGNVLNLAHIVCFWTKMDVLQEDKGYRYFKKELSWTEGYFWWKKTKTLPVGYYKVSYPDFFSNTAEYTKVSKEEATHPFVLYIKQTNDTYAKPYAFDDPKEGYAVYQELLDAFDVK